MPFEHITDVAYLKQQKKIPPKHHFQSKLKNQTTCNEQDYQIFTTIWKKLEITSLLQLFLIYSLLDATNLVDALAVYFSHLYSYTHIYPSNCRTISSLSQLSVLFNSKHPRDNTKKLQIPLLSQQHFNIFNKMLIGGYSSIFSHFTTSKNGINNENLVQQTTMIDGKLASVPIPHDPSRNNETQNMRQET